MEKIPTLFVRDEQDRRYVTTDVTPGCEWVLDGEGLATRKYDGTCVMLDDDGDWWARREVKPGKATPAGFVALSTDENTGKTVGWEPIDQSPFVKFHAEALGHPYERRHVGTYELCGPKINGNPDGFDEHVLVWHNDAETFDVQRDFDSIRDWLLAHQYEGLVFHHRDGRMVKIKRRDFR